jgi:hypothetical protein
MQREFVLDVAAKKLALVTWFISRGCHSWVCIAPLLAVLVAALLLPNPVAASTPDRWQTLTDAGTEAREQARYKEAERLFLLADQEAEDFDLADDLRATSLN